MKLKKFLQYFVVFSFVFICRISNSGENIYFGMSLNAFKESLHLSDFSIETPFSSDVKVIDSPEWTSIQKDLFTKFKFWCVTNGNSFTFNQDGLQAGICRFGNQSFGESLSVNALDFKNKEYAPIRHLIVFSEDKKTQKEIYKYFQLESLRSLNFDRGETYKYKKLSDDNRAIAAKGDVVCAIPNAYKVEYSPNESLMLGLDKISQSLFGYISMKGIIYQVELESYAIKVDSMYFIGESIGGNAYSYDVSNGAFSVKNDFGNFRIKVGSIIRDIKFNWYPCNK